VLQIEGGQLVYFELNDQTGQLKEEKTKFFDTEIKCIDIAEVAEGRKRAKFLAVGFADSTFKILSLEPESCLQKISVQVLENPPESICFMYVPDLDVFYLHVGQQNGVLVKSQIDTITGSISDTRQEFLGARSVRLTKIQIQRQEAVIAISSKNHLCFNHMGKYKCVPLSYGMLNHVAPLISERCQEGGMVVIAENSLRIIRIEKLGEQFTQSQLHTRYTPCKL
jgi:splicing factor 3B subunit 3